MREESENILPCEFGYVILFLLWVKTTIIVLLQRPKYFSPRKSDEASVALNCVKLQHWAKARV